MSAAVALLDGKAFWQRVTPRPAPRAVRRGRRREASQNIGSTGTVLLLCAEDDPQRDAIWRFLQSVLADGVALVELGSQAGRDIYARSASIRFGRSEHVVAVLRTPPGDAVLMAFAWFARAAGPEHVSVLGEDRQVLDHAPPGVGFITLDGPSGWKLPVLGALRHSAVPLDTSQLLS
jgi:hypothetical protein